jgi:hypothetical protein
MTPSPPPWERPQQHVGVGPTEQVGLLQQQRQQQSGLRADRAGIEGSTLVGLPTYGYDDDQVPLVGGEGAQVRWLRCE